MQSNALDFDWLNTSADRIEEILAKRSLPAHVDGGDIGARSIRFHLQPSRGITTEQVEQIGPEIARAVGVSEARILTEPNGIAIEVPIREDRNLRLLPLLAALEDLEPLTAVVGMTDLGRPLTLDLRDESSGHLWINGPEDTGKSELLRSLLVSLALGNRPAQLKILGIDVDGNDLTIIEALPHCLARLATDERSAQETIYWLEKEVGRRLRRGIQQPAILLLIDDLAWMDRKPSRSLTGSFRRMIPTCGGR
jgi:S-DNA-T family DNA segregation ATPase FtsK/SpoIIIE